MNELFIASPNVVNSSSDLRLLASKFGHYSGRFLGHFPEKWTELLQQHIDLQLDAGVIGDFERKRILDALAKAKRAGAFIAPSGASFNPQEEWLVNVERNLGRVFEQLIVRDRSEVLVDASVAFDDFDLPPTAGESIESRPEEYLRACKILLLASSELYFVDPYLNPFNRNVAKVIEALFGYLVASPQSRSLIVYARCDEVLASKRGLRTIDDLKVYFSALKTAEPRSAVTIEVRLVDDSKTHSRMHERGVFSIKGGVRFSQGFQVQKHFRDIDASPFDLEIHSKLMATYAEGRNDFFIRERFVV